MPGRPTLRGVPRGVNEISPQNVPKVLELTRFVSAGYVLDSMVADPEPPARGDAERGRPETRVRCPACGQRAAWQGNPHRPFCSLTCRLIDLGLWLDERYRIDADGTSDETPHDVP